MKDNRRIMSGGKEEKADRNRNYSGDSDYRDTRLAVGIKEEEKEEEEDTGRKLS